MKTCKITLRQAGNLFRVDRFTNTTQLSIGMMVDRERVNNWCAMGLVQVEVVGVVEEEENAIDLDGATDHELSRVDALEMASQSMKDKL